MTKRGWRRITPSGRPPALGSARHRHRAEERDDRDRQERERGLAEEAARERRAETASRVQITVCGPMIPAASPPAMTQPMARGLNASEAASVAAKR